MVYNLLLTLEFPFLFQKLFEHKKLHNSMVKDLVLLNFASEKAQVQKFQEIKHGCSLPTGSTKSGKAGHTNGVTVF